MCLAPALELGAGRILAITTRYRRTPAEATQRSTCGYPPPAQILGQLFNAVFLDTFDEDAARLERINSLVEELEPDRRQKLRSAQALVLRPSQDLGRLAAEYEAQLPAAFRFATRGLGTRETKSPDGLSFVLFQTDYLRRLIEIGEGDSAARWPEIAALLDDDPPVHEGELPLLRRQQINRFSTKPIAAPVA